MSAALKKAGKPIVFSLCEWGDNQPWEWAEPIGNLWRISGDIYPCYHCEHKHPGNWSSWGVLNILEMRKNIRQFSGPDHWNDFDMLEVGNGMTFNEDKTHFAMWCMVASPLIAGNDFRSMSAETLSILTNQDLIAINQDPLGIQAFKYLEKDGIAIWFKPLTNGNWAVSFLNKTDSEQLIQFDWNKEKVTDDLNSLSAAFDTIEYQIKDVWLNKKNETTKKAFKRKLASHDIITLVLTKK
jgi:alpha-galactosidase